MTVRRLLFKEKIWIPLVRAIKLHKGFLWFPIDPKLQPNWSRRLKRVRSIPDHRWKAEVPLFQEKIVLFHQSVNLNVFEVINFFCNRFERIFYSPSCLSEICHPHFPEVRGNALNVCHPLRWGWYLHPWPGGYKNVLTKDTSSTMFLKNCLGILPRGWGLYMMEDFNKSTHSTFWESFGRDVLKKKSLYFLSWMAARSL